MKIGICHYRIGKTDGVSLEIMKREQVFQGMGYDVKLIAGTRHIHADYSIPELEFEDPAVRKIKENAFFELKNYRSGDELMQDVLRIAATIEHQFLDIFEKEQFDMLFLHNIFSHVLHIPAARAFHAVAEEIGIPIVGVHHDFYWDGPSMQRYQATCEQVRDFLARYVPPKLSNIHHVTINSLDQKILRRQHDIESVVIPDTFDFEQDPWVVDDYNRSFLRDAGILKNDLVVLQATRVVERKGIELAIDLVTELTKRKSELVGKELYSGRVLTDDSRIVLVLAGYTEEFALSYRKRLEEYIEERGVVARFVDDYVDTWRGEKEDQKIYSLWDVYAHADLVTYPSIWEGWGNQFIEAVFAKKPIAVFEYPVYQSDIKPEGYDVISFGDVLGPDRAEEHLITVPPLHLETTVDQTITMLTSLKTPKILERNFEIGRRYHDSEVLRKLIKDLLVYVKDAEPVS